MTDAFPDTLSGVQRAAVLVVALGVEAAAQVLPSLSDDEVETLSVEIARLDRVPGAVVADVLDAFRASERAADAAPTSGGLEAARAVIGQLDEGRAARIEPRVLAATEGTGFDIAAGQRPQDLAGFLSREHPQTAAVVLSRLPARAAAATLEQLPQAVRGDVVRRLSRLQAPPDAALRDLDAALRRRFAPGAGGDDGVRRAADILTQSGRAVGDAVLDDIRAHTPDLAGQIRELLFVFDDLHRLDDRDLARVLSECDQGVLARALHGASADFSDRALRCVSDRVGAALLEEIEMVGSPAPDAIEEAQREVVAVVLRLAGDQAITVAPAGDA